jgi:hypothetical protein
MAVVYGPVVAEAWRKIKKPYKFTVDVVVHDQRHLTTDDGIKYFVELRVYENELLAFNEAKTIEIMEYLSLCQNMIQSYNIECILGGVAGDPPQPRRVNQ